MDSCSDRICSVSVTPALESEVAMFARASTLIHRKQGHWLSREDSESRWEMQCLRREDSGNTHGGRPRRRRTLIPPTNTPAISTVWLLTRSGGTSVPCDPTAAWITTLCRGRTHGGARGHEGRDEHSSGWCHCGRDAGKRRQVADLADTHAEEIDDLGRAGLDVREVERELRLHRVLVAQPVPGRT